MKDDMLAEVKEELVSKMEYLDIKDEADALAHLCMQLSFFYKQPVDIFLDEPASRIPLYVAELKRMESEARRRLNAT